MDELDLIIDLHGGGERQGPGSRAATLRAAELAGLLERDGLRIADLGCGTGSASLLLAQTLAAEIHAVDLVPRFLETLQVNAAGAVLKGRISTYAASIDDLPFNAGDFDVIWSEGAIYNIGFEAGLRSWRPYLRVGGVLAVSELTWLTESRPAPIDTHWQTQYPGVATAGEKIRQLEQAGYRPLGYFPLDRDCWIANFYAPLQSRLDDFRTRHGNSELATAVADAEQRELELYERYGDYYSYGFYIAERRPDGD